VVLPRGDRVFASSAGDLNYFPPRPPSGEENNRVPTSPGKPWFTMFRLYGPHKAVFELSESIYVFDKLPHNRLFGQIVAKKDNYFVILEQ
jgi:hypothetical protein